MSIANSIFQRVSDVNEKSKNGFSDITSKYVVIDRNDSELCEKGLCQYIYVMRRSDIEEIKYFSNDSISLEKKFDLDFFDERVEFFNNEWNCRNLYSRFRFVGLTNEDIIREDFSDEVSRMASKGFLNLIKKDEYFFIRPLSSVAIIEENGTISVYRTIKKSN